MTLRNLPGTMPSPALHTTPAPPVLEVPVILFAFNRPAYLERVCASLLRQRDVVLDPRRVFLLQDGAVSPRTGLRYAEDAEVEASIAAFRAHFPRGHVAAARANLGVAANIRRGEVLAFEALDADCAYFFEDDLELGPEYLRMMEQLRALSDRDPRVGYFAAYGRHQIELPGHEARIFRMAHHWGFGLRREPWRRLREWLAPYDEILQRSDYSGRDHLAIFRWMETLTVATPFSSQDAAKTLGCNALGIARIMTDLCFAQYIGAVGSSFSDEKFREQGFDRMRWVEGSEYRLAVEGGDPVGGIIADRRAFYEKQRRTDFATFMEQYARTHFEEDRPATREEAAWLYKLLLARLPDGEELDAMAGTVGVRELRSRLLQSTEFHARNPNHQVSR
jgi:hypothetical protein